MHDKKYTSRFAKMTYNLERGEYKPMARQYKCMGVCRRSVLVKASMHATRVVLVGSLARRAAAGCCLALARVFRAEQGSPIGMSTTGQLAGEDRPAR